MMTVLIIDKFIVRCATIQTYHTQAMYNVDIYIYIYQIMIDRMN